MNAIVFLVAAIFALSLHLAPLHGDAVAKSTKKTAKKAAATEIPKNININSADKDTLALLPGFGPANTATI